MEVVDPRVPFNADVCGLLQFLISHGIHGVEHQGGFPGAAEAVYDAHLLGTATEIAFEDGVAVTPVKVHDIIGQVA